MTDRGDASALRWLIGNELRLARERAGRKQGEAAALLGCSQAKINYLETGRNKQQPDEVSKLLHFYEAGAAKADRLAAIAGHPDQGTWWADFEDVVPDWFATFVGLEGLASREFVYETMTIPGLLQTREYATALLNGHLRVPVIDIEQVVNLRIARQQSLYGSSPLHFEVVVEESVLDRVVGGHEVMQAQLRHIVSLCERDNITLRVMPLSVPVHDGIEGEFMVLDFEQAQSIGYIEYPSGAIYIQNQEQVAGYTKAAQRLNEAALTPEQSLRAVAARLS
ncbi:XRE family transcriptional regulator [Actinopolyspora erythraea]|uniref:Cro/Cl family transcriptional regulator n=1 Tax=Actinopolyspora erythraea TaxID=414996 RepID=A0A099D5D1_9ACTN|nr:helix-turn-helix transcriptional regulator [Actinopolyspora erythraea]ASU77641.1 XRE family transcriptional regulator [Actinopolyspora erythraea]KGI80520.1 Cro/Cl family transcriptional regulator [Actinopolyspora erythraea]